MDSSSVQAWAARLRALGVDAPEPRRVLLVDDEPENLDVLAMLLEDDYEVHRASTGHEALALVDHQERGGRQDAPSGFAAVVTDQRMPGMTGIELLGELARRSPETVRLVLTAYADVPPIVAAINEGRVYRFLLKPWDPDEMRAAVAEAVWIHRGRATLARLLAMETRRRRELADAIERVRRSEQEIVASERMSTLGRFTTGITHDLRNSLTVMMSLLELVQQSPPELAVLRAAQQAFQTLDALLRLVNDVNAFARGRSPRANRVPVDVLPFLEKIVNVFRSDPQSRGRSVRIAGPAEPARWFFDEGQIRQALLALLRSASASAAAAAEAPLEIALVRDGGAAGFDVRHAPGDAPARAADGEARAGEAGALAAASVGILGQEIGRVAAEAHGGRLVVRGAPGREISLALWIGEAVPGEKAA